MDIGKNIVKIRAEFPQLKYLIRLGAAGTAPICRKMLNAIKDIWSFRLAGSNLGGTGNVYFLSIPQNVMKRAEIEAAKLINAKEKEISWNMRVSRGIQIIIDAIAHNDPWKKGDNVVFSDQGFAPSGSTWLSLIRKGIELRRVKSVNGKILPYGGPSIKEKLIEGCRIFGDIEQALDENTKIVCINHTTSNVGFTHNVRTVTKLAHENGALVIDDAYQAIGAIKIDVKKNGLDFLVAGGCKWQCGPPDAGILWIREKIVDEWDPPHTMYTHVLQPRHLHFSQPQHDNITSYFGFPFEESAQKFSDQCMAMSTIWGYHAALKWLNELGPENIQKRDHKLSMYMMERLQEIGCDINTPIEDKTTLENLHLLNYSTGSHEKDLKSYRVLNEHTPIPFKGLAMRYLSGVGGIRVGTHFWNTVEDVDKFIEAQRDLLSKT